MKPSKPRKAIRFLAWLFLCQATTIWAQNPQLRVSLGEAIGVDGPMTNVCRVGEPQSNPRERTQDKMTQSTYEQSFAPCRRDVCFFDQRDANRPFQVKHEFKLVKNSGSEELQRPQWSRPEFPQIRRDDPGEFQILCGQSYVRSIERGGTLSVLVTASFRSDEERTIFLQETQFDLANLRTIAAHLDRARDSDGVLSLSLEQVGGDQAALSYLLGQGDRFLLCRLREAEGCMRTLQALVGYGLTTWADTLDATFNSGDRGSLQVLGYQTANY
jgi:hypothetical protein